MAQAKVLSERELKGALAVIATRRHSDRDRLALIMTWLNLVVADYSLKLEIVQKYTSSFCP
jgi:integrase/recombinase XerD